MSRSIYPTGGARTPRLRMTTKDAVALYRAEVKAAEKRWRIEMEAERVALEEAMTRLWNPSARSGRPHKAPPAPNVCMCGCGLMCQGTRRTASDDCLRRVQSANNAKHKRTARKCVMCKRPFHSRNANALTCGVDCRRRRASIEQKQALERHRQRVHFSTTTRPNEAA
jgi:hypothetical protein